MKSCFECGSTKKLTNHHVIPRSLGGKRTLPLCSSCHAKIHDKAKISHASLTKRALGKMRKKGLRISRHPPYGFDLASDKKHLIKNAREQKAIKLMTSLRHDGLSFPKIAQELDRRGIRTKYGGNWNQASVNGILRRCKVHKLARRKNN